MGQGEKFAVASGAAARPPSIALPAAAWKSGVGVRIEEAGFCAAFLGAVRAWL